MGIRCTASCESPFLAFWYGQRADGGVKGFGVLDTESDGDGVLEERGCESLQGGCGDARAQLGVGSGCSIQEEREKVVLKD